MKYHISSAYLYHAPPILDDPKISFVDLFLVLSVDHFQSLDETENQKFSCKEFVI